MKWESIEDLPTFFLEHAEDLSGTSLENGGLKFINALAFLIEHNSETFEYNKGESEERAFKRYKMERSSKQVNELVAPLLPADEDDEEGK